MLCGHIEHANFYIFGKFWGLHSANSLHWIKQQIYCTIGIWPKPYFAAFAINFSSLLITRYSGMTA